MPALDACDRVHLRRVFLLVVDETVNVDVDLGRKQSDYLLLLLEVLRVEALLNLVLAEPLEGVLALVATHCVALVRELLKVRVL